MYDPVLCTEMNLLAKHASYLIKTTTHVSPSPTFLHGIHMHARRIASSCKSIELGQRCGCADDIFVIFIGHFRRTVRYILREKYHLNEISVVSCFKHYLNDVGFSNLNNVYFVLNVLRFTNISNPK